MNAHRVATLLAANIQPMQVASIIGVSPARISQIMQDESFKEILAAKRAEADLQTSEEANLNQKYEAVEQLLLNEVMAKAPLSELRDVTAALRVVAERQEKAKSRVAPIFQGNVVNNQTIVQLSLPAHALPEILMTTRKEVIAIGETELAPLSSKGVTDLFKARNQANIGDNHVQDRLSEEASRSPTQALQEATIDFDLTALSLADEF